ncbi:ABC transporter substrate-binding protein [Paenibacillus puerhi]|uniref:ABC transporter substrate-binding protein n=1 Tax=Paenibacillus puerhi TaxID=2692622 RepID=UPI001358775B|nr:ABC transporter substrate-binding protein [Paenibacillus puerhi]
MSQFGKHTKKTGRRWFSFGLMSTIFIGIVGCGVQPQAEPAAAAKPAEDIALAVAGPFTGDGATYGKSFKNGAELAVAQFNAAGGYQGRKVKLVYGDDKNDPKEAANTAQKLASDPANLAVVGHWSSSATLAAIPIYNRSQIPMITPTGSHPDITKKENTWIFRSCATTEIETKYNSDFIVNKQGKKSIAILYINSDWGKSEAEFLKKHIEGLGGKVVAYESYPPGQGIDFTAALTKIKGTKPDGIVLASLVNEGVLILKQAKQLGIETQFFGPATFYTEEFLKDPEVVEGFYLDALFFPETDDPTGKKFVSDYKQQFGQADPGFFEALAYDSTNLILEAIRRGGATRSGIRDSLAGIKDFRLVTGVAAFDENRSDTNKTYTNLVVKNGKFALTK